MSARKPSARAVRRDLARTNAKFVRDAERLAKLEPGGSPERPIEVGTASLVEPRTQGMPCPLCSGKLRVDEHTAETFAGALLRVTRSRCTQCGTPRTLYFRVVVPRGN